MIMLIPVGSAAPLYLVPGVGGLGRVKRVL
jgi:hypothetical protein